ncbi:type II toxin-antitoxin system YoeB family toxin [Endozoicomonas sp. ONNA2]|nr:type II toxin-antitoxin system YoeB family toxin [Endozoicomonas sp. ONNA2]
MISSPRLLCWSQKAWDDYQFWQEQDRKTLKRINKLIIECLRDPGIK